MINPSRHVNPRQINPIRHPCKAHARTGAPPNDESQQAGTQPHMQRRTHAPERLGEDGVEVGEAVDRVVAQPAEEVPGRVEGC